MNSKTRRGLIRLFVFAVSMGFFESSIVVYLRELYYPDGFSFPLQKVGPQIALTEFIREAASMVMLISVAMLVFKRFYRQFAAFLFIFAVWDIFYYIFLKLILNWPDSLFTWDILFLIPVTWTGPVISPVLVSLLMILLALVILYFDDNIKGQKFHILVKEWLMLIAGAFIVFLAFIWDYSSYILENIHPEEIDSLSGYLRSLTLKYMPQQFNWPLFLLGILVILISIFLIYKRNNVSLR